MSIYTKSERTVKKYTVQDAVDSAKRRLKGIPMCINAVTKMDLDEKITLERLNEIASEIVADSHYYY